MEYQNNRPANPVRVPAVGLLITGLFNLLLGVLWLLSFVLRAAGLQPPAENAVPSGVAGATYRTGGRLVLLVLAGSSAAAPFVIRGALAMLRGRDLAAATRGAKLAIIPLTSCCFILGIPLGIWALILLNQPEVKAFFAAAASDNAPPPPPQYS